MKTVLITGAGGNLGAAAVKVFADAGWKVAAIVSPGKKPQSSERVTFYEADLEDEEMTGSLISQIIVGSGGLDAALLLVGGFESGDLARTDGESIKRMFSLNFETAFYSAKPVAIHVQERGAGKIFFIGARPALDPKAGKGLMAYGLSKSLLFKLAEYLNEAASRTLAHVVVFHALDTPQNRASMPKADRSSWVTPEYAAKRMLALAAQTGGEMVAEIKNA